MTVLVHPHARSPFPYFGGKRAIATKVWLRLGDCPNFISPLFGSGAELLSRPHYDWDRAAWRADAHNHVETVNDSNGMLCNFWRALQSDPQAVARAADWPVNECDLHARRRALQRRLHDPRGLSADEQAEAARRGVSPFAALLERDPDFCEPCTAGWWVWGMSCWIGDGLTRQGRSLPAIGDAGRGAARQLPNIGGGPGCSGGAQRGACARQRAALSGWFAALSDRLRHVRVCCGDFERVLGDSVLGLKGGNPTPCAVFLDPPYSQDAGCDTVYADHHARNVSARAREWARVRAADPRLRIALCGYAGEHEALEAGGWSVLNWKARGGYGNQDGGDNPNSSRERVWFSPHCLRPEEPKNFMLQHPETRP